MKIIRILLLILCMVLIFGNFAFAKTAKTYKPGDVIDDFSVETSDGTTYTLSELLKTHEAVLINIWGSWCGPCCMELPYLQEVYEECKNDVAMLCLSEFDTNEEIEQFKGERGLTTLPMGYDTTGLSKALVKEGYPTTIIIDRFGVYVRYECGSLPNTEAVKELFTDYMGNDYLESALISDDATSISEEEVPDAEELKNALGVEGDIAFTSGAEGKKWPFVIRNGKVYSSNTQEGTEAVLEADVNAKAGDVISFDYSIKALMAKNRMCLYVDDCYVFTFTDEESGTYAYCFETEGSHSVRWVYTVSETLSSDKVCIDNVKLLSGREAQAAIAAMPVYPHTLEGVKMTITPINEGTRKVRINDPSGGISEAFGNAEFYLVPGDTAKVRIEIGTDIDASMCIVAGDYDGKTMLLKNLENDGNAYYFDTSLSSRANGGFSNTYILIQAENGIEWIAVWNAENELDAFCVEEAYDTKGNLLRDVTWEYGDETTDADPIHIEYRVLVVDEEGKSVQGAMINVCTDTACTPGYTDEKGIYSFIAEEYPYVIHVIDVPDAYKADPEADYVMDDTAQMTITVRRR